MELSDIYDMCKIDWTNCYGTFDDCQNDSEIEFDVMPEDFLSYAKNNMKVDSIQSRIDAMGNAKKAIEAQIDLLISTIGFDYRKFDKRETYPTTKKYINLGK